MRKNPWPYTIFRIIFGLVFLFLFGMLYWSSLDLEEDIKELKAEVLKTQTLINNLALKNQSSWVAQSVVKPRPLMDASLANLLKEDPFYTTTLPDLILPKNFVPRGTRRLDTIGKPNSLHPFINLYPFSAYIDQCGLTLAALHVGKYETLAPDLAIKMEERKEADGSIVYWIHLRDNVFWHPLNPAYFPEGTTVAPWFLEKHPVTAHDVKFYFDAMMNPFVSEGGAIAMRNYFKDIESVQVIDNLTLTVKWKQELIDGKYRVKYAAKSLTCSLKPLASFVYQYHMDGSKIVEEEGPETYRNNSVWAEQFATHFAKNIIVSCGPWLFEGMSDHQIRFRRNPDYFNPLAVLVEAMEVNFKDTPEAIWQDFQVGAIDLYSLDSSKILDLQDFLHSPAYAKEKALGHSIEQLPYVDRAFYYIGWNERTPLFALKEERMAMTSAIDRDRLILQNLNHLGVAITGTFALDSPAYDPLLQAIPFDPEAAKRLLEAVGWIDNDGDGIRDKMIQGKCIPFRFSLKYYVKSPLAKKNCESIRSMFLDIGVDCRPEGLDIADLMQAMDDKEFDAIYFGWMLGAPPEDPRQVWHSSGAYEKGSSNMIGFENKEADLIIEALNYEEDPKRRVELYHAFSEILHEEQPYTFLFSPKVTLCYRDYVKNIFIPSERQDLIPGADIAQPDLHIIYFSKEE